MFMITTRMYSTPEDLQLMIDLLVAVRAPERISDFPGIVDVNEAMSLNTVRSNTRLWFDSNIKMTAFAYVDQYNNLWFEYNKWAAYPSIETEIVAWGIECVQRAVETSGEPLTLDASCRSDNTEKIALLERQGFLRQDLQSLQMVRNLDEPIPNPQLPVGFRIRNVQSEQDVEPLVALHRAAFGTENMTVEERLVMMRVPEYDPELDLLAISPDGKFAATCMCSISQEENEYSRQNVGHTDPIATHPDFRRLGLAKALLLTGLHMLKQRGIGAARLGTSSDNLPMQRVAEEAGFRVQSTTLWFTFVFG